jgi:transcriptional regulator with XRE-family HTH domain
MPFGMPRKSTLDLPPLELGDETLGQRLARLRKQKGLTQVELAERIGIIQSLVSEYERDKLRLNAQMLARFALALGVSADELLGLDEHRQNGSKVTLKVARRMQLVERLPPQQQATLLKTIDAFLKAAGVDTDAASRRP